MISSQLAPLTPVSLVWHHLAADRAGIMAFEPGIYAVLVKQMLAWQLVDFVFVLEFLHADLAVFGLDDIGALDDLQFPQELFGCWTALCAVCLVHEVCEGLLESLVQLLVLHLHVRTVRHVQNV